VTTEALITVGGSGSRLRRAGVQLSSSKSFIEIRHEPIIFWNLLVLKLAGFTRVVFCSQSKGTIRLLERELRRITDLFQEISFEIDEGLGTAGLPFHFRECFDGPFFFICGHSFLRPEHFFRMRRLKSAGNIVISSYAREECVRNLHILPSGRIVKRDQVLDLNSRIIDYPYVVDDKYCRLIASHDFDVLSTVTEYANSGMLECVHSQLPVEIDELEQFRANLPIISREVEVLGLPRLDVARVEHLQKTFHQRALYREI
jgi:hypothetical protein